MSETEPVSNPGAIRLPSGQDAVDRGRAAIEQVSELIQCDQFTAALKTRINGHHAFAAHGMQEQ